MKVKNTDRLKFKNGKQSEFLRLAAKRIGSLRGLARFIGISWGYFWYYVDEQITLPYKIFKTILPLTPLSQEELLNNWIGTVLPRYWGCLEGAKIANKVIQNKMKKSNEYRENWREKCKKGGMNIKRKFITNWDVGFRKAGRRNANGPKGEKMFNEYEKNIAIYLLSKGIDYKYEPMMKMNGNFYFPDFVVNGTIIERCGLLTSKYLQNLKRKINDYLDCWNGKIIFVCPKRIINKLKAEISSSQKVIIISEDNLENMAKIV